VVCLLHWRGLHLETEEPVNLRFLPKWQARAFPLLGVPPSRGAISSVNTFQIRYCDIPDAIDPTGGTEFAFFT
jgi:hypothetical protein